MNDLVPHTRHGTALQVILRTVAGQPVCELRAEGRHVVSWRGAATRTALLTAIKEHEQRHHLHLNGWCKVGRLVAQHHRGGPPTARDAARLRHVDRTMKASWRLLHRLWAACDWLGIEGGQIPLPPPDGRRRLDGFYPPWVEPEPEPVKPKRKPRQRKRRDRTVD